MSQEQKYFVSRTDPFIAIGIGRQRHISCYQPRPWKEGNQQEKKTGGKRIVKQNS